MKSLHFLILITLMLGTAACATAETSHLTASSIDSAGTSVSTERTTKEDTGILGTKKSQLDETTEVDPRGMLNKTVTSKHEETSASPNGNQSQEKRTIDTAGTSRDESNEKTISKHWTDSGETITTTKKVEIDPKGLMNKQTGELEVEVERSPDGATKRTVTKTINGDKVSETSEVKR